MNLPVADTINRLNTRQAISVGQGLGEQGLTCAQRQSLAVCTQ